MNSKAANRFCRPSCEMIGTPECLTQCAHNEDRVFVDPQTVNVRFLNGWKETKIIGSNGDRLYLEDGGSVKITSPLLKD